MAFAATTHWQTDSAGSNTFGGGFDPGNASMASDLAATVANTSAPVVTSASYNFVAGDVGHWVFIKSGTNWTPGWYKIASVASNAATLNGTIGAAVLAAEIPTTVVGCATVASPTAGTWSVDYSQSTTAKIAFTDLVIDGTTNTNATSAANPFGKNHVGNVINVTAGTGFTVQRVQIASVSTVTATMDKSLGTLSSTGGTGNLGGALADYATAVGVAIGSNAMWVKLGSYTQAANPTVNPGAVTIATGVKHTRVIGFQTVRGDAPTGANRPTITLSSASTAGISFGVAGTRIENMIVDCGSLNTTTGISQTTGEVWNCKVSNFKVAGITTGGGVIACCEVTGGISGATGALNLNFASEVWGNYVHDNVCPGIFYNTGGAFSGYVYGNLVTANTGASSDGMFISGYQASVWGNTVVGNGRDGIRLASGNQALQTIVKNNILALNGVSAAGYGLNFSSGDFGNNSGALVDGNFYGHTGQANTTGDRNNCGVCGPLFPDLFFTGDPFTAKASNDWSLNSTANAGAVIRNAGYPTKLALGGTTSSYPDGGAAQANASGGGTTLILIDDD